MVEGFPESVLPINDITNIQYYRNALLVWVAHDACLQGSRKPVATALRIFLP